jgi:CO/xanthine dehydrogenase FAD-binding subunit
MASVDFDYVAVSSYQEAVEALARGGEEAKVLAGGQSLVPMMNLRLVRPELLVDLNPIGAAPPSVNGSTLVLGGLTRHRTLLETATVRRHCPLLAEAVRYVGNARVRNRGTLGGSLAHADPTSELGACALALGAEIVVQGPSGSRTIPAHELFVSYLTTSLMPAEVVTDVRVPVKARHEGWGFAEMVRRTSDLAIAAAAATVVLEEDGTARHVTLSFAGVAERVVSAEDDAVRSLVGSTGDDRALGSAAAGAVAALSPSSDVHASGEYRRRVAAVLARRALRSAFDRAAEGTSDAADDAADGAADGEEA